MLFRDRADAGRQLLSKLGAYRGRPDVLVLGLPRGGIPVGYEVARGLGAPLDVFVVRKLGVPGQEELAMGAIATGGVRVVNRDVVDALHIPPDVLDRAAAEELRELERREQSYRGERPQPRVEGRTVILVDDGLATGSTMRAAVAALRQQGPARIVVAVPVAAPSTCAELRRRGGRGGVLRDAGAVHGRRPVLRRFLADDGRRGPGAAGVGARRREEAARAEAGGSHG